MLRRSFRNLSHSSSNGNQYLVMAYRYDTPVLLIHWTDIDPNGGTTGTYGNTVLTDCNPETTTWDDAGCSLGQHIELDADDESTSLKVWEYVYSALDDGKLKVTLSTGVWQLFHRHSAAPPPYCPRHPGSSWATQSTTASSGNGQLWEIHAVFVGLRTLVCRRCLHVIQLLCQHVHGRMPNLAH